ncbi:lytic transglycosylase, partial [Mesorhizobium sp. M8A.F.Ca.ET.142.01.1.1]
MHRFLAVALALLCSFSWVAGASADPPQSKSAAKRLINRVCDLIEAQAQQNG